MIPAAKLISNQTETESIVVAISCQCPPLVKINSTEANVETTDAPSTRCTGGLHKRSIWYVDDVLFKETGFLHMSIYTAPEAGSHKYILVPELYWGSDPTLEHLGSCQHSCDKGAYGDGETVSFENCLQAKTSYCGGKAAAVTVAFPASVVTSVWDRVSVRQTSVDQALRKFVPDALNPHILYLYSWQYLILAEH